MPTKPRTRKHREFNLASTMQTHFSKLCKYKSLRQSLLAPNLKLFISQYFNLVFHVKPACDHFTNIGRRNNKFDRFFNSYFIKSSTIFYFIFRIFFSFGEKTLKTVMQQRPCYFLSFMILVRVYGPLP